MRKKKKNKLPNLKLCIIGIILIIIIMFIRSNFTPLGKAYKTLKYINKDDFDNNVVTIVNNFYWYEDYSGEITPVNVNKSAYYLSTTLIPEYKKITDIEKYYRKHKKEIRALLGIKDKTEFEILVSKIKLLQGDDLKFEKYFIVDDSDWEENGLKAAVLAIQYENNEPLLLNIKISNEKKKKKSPVKYSANVEKNLKVTRDNTIYIPKNDENKAAGRVLE